MGVCPRSANQNFGGFERMEVLYNPPSHTEQVSIPTWALVIKANGLYLNPSFTGLIPLPFVTIAEYF